MQAIYAEATTPVPTHLSSRSAALHGDAEVAFAVDADWRRLGLGSALLEAATRWAEHAGVVTLRMVISRNNWPMR
jgi:GNAT superfamily N-acetyltransferase